MLLKNCLLNLGLMICLVTYSLPVGGSFVLTLFRFPVLYVRHRSGMGGVQMAQPITPEYHWSAPTCNFGTALMRDLCV